MSRFQNFETSALLDMLSQYTRRLTELFIKKDLGREYHEYKRTIQELQAEIERRKNSTNDEKASSTHGNSPGKPPI